MTVRTKGNDDMEQSAKSVADAEKDVRQSRARVEETLDQIQDRLSPGQLVDQAVTYFREGSGGEVARNFGNSIKQNPMPLALVAVGVAWMMASGSRPANGNHGSHASYPSRDPGYAFSRTGAASVQPVVAGSASVSPAATGTTGTSAGHGKVTHQLRQGARDVGDRISRAGDQVREQGAEAAEGVRQGVNDLGDRVSRAGDEVRYHGVMARQSLVEAFTRQPLALGALGIAVGAAIGGLLPGTRTEDELMGEHRDKLVERAEEVGRDQLAKAQKTGEAAVAAGKAEAEQQGMTPERSKETPKRTTAPQGDPATDIGRSTQKPNSIG